MLGLLILSLLADPQAPATPPPGPVEWQLVVATPVYQPDGNKTSETRPLMDATAFVYGRRSICDPGAASGKEPADAGYGWRLTSRTVSRTPFELVVAVDWRRLWDGGQKLANGPAGTVELTLHPGDRIPLDHIPNNTRNDACRAVGMGLEVRLARSGSPARPIDVTLPLGSVSGGAKPLDADVWLVHARPAGGEEVLHQRVRLPADGAPFAFAPVAFTTARGEVSVEVAGAFQRLRNPGGLEQIIVQMSRLVTGASAPANGFGGASAKLIPLPLPTDVLSFEMPAPEARAGMRGGGGGGGVAAVGPGGAGRMTSGAGNAGSTGGSPGARSAGGGGGRGGASGPAAAAGAQLTGILEGHVFSIRVRLVPVAGS
jgi:hypothetical protein